MTNLRASLLAGALIFAASSAARADTPRAGAAALEIAPPIGVPLAGYGARGPGNCSTGTHSPVWARALVVEGRGGTPRIGLVVLDVLIATPSLRKAVAERTPDLDLDLLVIAATHTHSGPGGYLDDTAAEMAIMGWHRDAAEEAVVSAAVSVLRQAAGALAPARFATASARAADFAHNRRREGGPQDPEVPILLVDGEQGTIATLFSFAAHPTVLSPANDKLHADYPGPARRRIESSLGGVAIFLAGPLGDQAPHLEGEPEWTGDAARELETARKLGLALGMRVVDAARQATPASDPVVAFQSDEWPLPGIDVQARCAWWVGAPLLHLAARRFLPPAAPIVALRLGDLRILASPFELGVEVAAAIRRRAPAPLMVAAHSNAWLGYLLEPEDYDRGGYEPCMAYHGRGVAPLFEDEAARVLGQLP